MPTMLNMKKFAVLALCMHQAIAFAPVHPRALKSRIGTFLKAELDYTDPVVAAEYEKVQSLPLEDVEMELAMMGVKPDPSMGDVEIKLMLVETNLMMAGWKPGDKQAAPKKAKKTSFKNDFEKAMYEKPAFEALYKEKMEADDINSANVMSEYITNPQRTADRYGDTYAQLLKDVDAALNAKVEQAVTTPKVGFAGFPSNLGEEGVRMTLAAAGELVDFTCTESDDMLTLEGTAEYGDVATAKSVIEQYDGMDMGMDTKLEITAM